MENMRKETIEEFIARGGKVEKVKKNMRDELKPTMRVQRKVITLQRAEQLYSKREKVEKREPINMDLLPKHIRRLLDN